MIVDFLLTICLNKHFILLLYMLLKKLKHSFDAIVLVISFYNFLIQKLCFPSQIPKKLREITKSET